MSLQLSDDSEDFEDNNDDDEFKGVFKLSVTKKELLIILAPFVLKLVGSYLSNLLDSGFYFNLIFGLMHIGNIVNGAKLSIALIQGIATIFGGFLFMALYLRTGSIWPSIVGRMISVPAHMTFNMVMGEFLGRAKFSKLSGKGSAALNYVLALLVPIAVHTLYDVCTAFNSSLMRGEVSGMVRAMIGYVGLLVYEFVVLVRCKKKTEMFCSMSTLAEEAT